MNMARKAFLDTLVEEELLASTGLPGCRGYRDLEGIQVFPANQDTQELRVTKEILDHLDLQPMLAALALQSKDYLVTQVPVDYRALAVTREHRDSLDCLASQGLEVMVQVVVLQGSLELTGQREKRVTQAYQALALKDFLAHLASQAHLDLLDHRAHLAWSKAPASSIPSGPSGPKAQLELPPLAFLDSPGCLDPEELQVQLVSKASEVTLVTANAKEEAHQV